MGNVVKLPPERITAVPPGRPEELSGADALRHIRALMKTNSRCVKFWPHAKRRGKQRGITLRQALTCLEKGVVTEGHYIDAHDNWKLNVTRVAAGQEITCVVIIMWPESVIVHTAFPGRG
jgi:hypothetical protein